MKLWSAVSTAVFSIALIAAMLPTAASAVTATVPSAPTAVVGTAGNGSVTVTWTGSSSDGGAAISGYTVTATPGGATATFAGNVGPFTKVIPATNGTAYTYTVHATNGVGNSVESAASSPVTPGTVPLAPGTVVASGTGVAGEVTVTWPAPTSSGGSPISGYTVTGTPAGTCTTTGATTCTISGLSTTTFHTFKAAATNSFGTGPQSTTASNSIKPSGLAATPTTVTATAGDGQAVLAWVAPVNTGGSPITGYVLTVTGAGGGTSATAGASATGVTVTGLTNGIQYTVKVAATNSNGTGTFSGGTTVTPLAKPGVPTGVTAAPNGTSGRLNVTWVDPASNGGAAITGYTATASNGATCTTNTSPTDTTCPILIGLTDGVPVTVTVHSTTGAGNSAESAPSASAASGTGPLVPGTSVATATGNTGEVSVTWPAPAGDGGSPITGSTVVFASGGTVGATACTASGLSQTCTATGLTNPTSYTFKVFATNAIGVSPTTATASNAAVPFGPPSAPTALVVSAVSGTGATLTWVAGATNGSTVSGFTMTATPASGTAITKVIAGSGSTTGGFTTLLDATSYTFTVHANSTTGNGPDSASASATTSATTPSAPLGLALGHTSSTSITPTWAAPTVVGPGVDHYMLTVTATVGGALIFSGNQASGVAVTGLTTGTSYTFTVHAVTTTGTTVAGADASAAAVAGALPIAPLTAVGTPNYPTGVVTASWTAAVLATAVPDGTFVRYEATLLDAGLPAGSSAIATCSANAFGTLSCPFTGVTGGTGLYTVSVVVVSTIGTGPAKVSATFGSPPGAPTIVSATPTTGDGEVTVTWAAPTLTGGSAIASYTVTAVPTTGTTVVTGGVTTLTKAITTLVDGMEYTFTVTATNTTGSYTGPASGSLTATSSGAPAIPSVGIMGPGNGSVAVSWTATPTADTTAGDNGSAVDFYRVEAAPGGASCTATGATTCTVAGLTNGVTYTFKVWSHNSSPKVNTLPPGITTPTTGWSATSLAVGGAIPSAVPGAPTNVIATAGNGSVAVTWARPSSNGAAAIAAYTVTASPGTAACVTTGSVTASCTVTGLTNGTFYTLSVVASNAAGVSPAGTSASVQPRAGAALNTTVNHAFTDVGTVGTEAANAIAALFNTTPAITQGLNATTYGPLNPVNRANMAVFLSRSIQAVGHAVNTTVNHTFADVAGLTAEQQSSIAAIGNTTPAVTNGFNATTYGPASTVSREGMAAFLSRTWQSLGGTCDNTVNHTFGDVGTSFAQADIACVNNLGIANGTSATTFDPTAPVNRLQMALFLFRLVDAAVAQGL